MTLLEPMNQLVRDPIWGTPAARLFSTEEAKWRRASGYDSPRCGGQYIFHETVYLTCFSREGKCLLTDNEKCLLTDNEKCLLTTWLIEQRRNGIECPIITHETVEDTKQRSRMSVSDRADAILRYIESKVSKMGQYINYASRDPIQESWQGGLTLRQINRYELIAFSESVDYDELTFLLNYLEKRGWIEIIPGIHDDTVDMSGPTVGVTIGSKSYTETYTTACLLTFEGYARLAEIQETRDSSRGFMAMWFDQSMNDAWENGFEPGIKKAGYEPMRIDKKEHSNRIDDEIIAEIRRARFIVADLTHGDRGVRGGVYYEAGFAHGLGIPVIFTCREDCSNNTHFDIRQYNCIRWKDDDFEKLQKDLKNRITAIIGDGPRSSAN